MKYFVRKFDLNDQTEELIFLSQNKKKLKGKWQIFVKEVLSFKTGYDDIQMSGFYLKVGDVEYNVLDDRREIVK